ncbi:hypothetical protein [Pelosinus baikalensis]|uniref:Uncharacterized protein n=1 Tax=Pelosinus baikalensis TaxID=2892015 RepID=A0ABS8HRF0_9FIRM|nr:hypothetical protein [Pelosinus baikalensis]MCC5465134.1 hypothetical protein [Pelosinus baikalensis]MCC5465251.1 hypothetical protein [Pelosinus baikalensis]
MEQKSVAAKQLFTNKDLFKLFLPVIIAQIFVYRNISGKWTTFHAI